MCSIVGAAGQIADLPPKLRQEFHEFLSCLFTMAELRGRDAAGFWVWRGDHYVYEKRPIPAEDLIQRSPRWKSLRFNPGSLYLLHTRAATDGDPNENVNNHPHIGEHGVMVHNGCVWNHESIVHAESLDMKSECDSEVLLRLTEARDDAADGLENMFLRVDEHTSTASIAVAFVDRRNPDRIYLARNSGNPCYLYRSERFNCTFFVSTEQIFDMAIEWLYGVKTPKVIGAKSDCLLTHELYELLEDGTSQHRHLVTLPTKYGGYHRGVYGGQYNYDDDDDDVEARHYARVLLNRSPYSVSVTGEMEPLGEAADEEEYEEDNADLEFMEAMTMPDDVEDRLRAYIAEKMSATT